MKYLIGILVVFAIAVGYLRFFLGYSHYLTRWMAGYDDQTLIWMAIGLLAGVTLIIFVLAMSWQKIQSKRNRVAYEARLTDFKRSIRR